MASISCDEGRWGGNKCCRRWMHRLHSDCYISFSFLPLLLLPPPPPSSSCPSSCPSCPSFSCAARSSFLSSASARTNRIWTTVDSTNCLPQQLHSDGSPTRSFSPPRWRRQMRKATTGKHRPWIINGSSSGRFTDRRAINPTAKDAGKLPRLMLANIRPDVMDVTFYRDGGCKCNSPSDPFLSLGAAPVGTFPFPYSLSSADFFLSFSFWRICDTICIFLLTFIFLLCCGSDDGRIFCQILSDELDVVYRFGFLLRWIRLMMHVIDWWNQTVPWDSWASWGSSMGAAFGPSTSKTALDGNLAKGSRNKRVNCEFKTETRLTADYDVGTSLSSALAFPPSSLLPTPRRWQRVTDHNSVAGPLINGIR